MRVVGCLGYGLFPPLVLNIAILEVAIFKESRQRFIKLWSEGGMMRKVWIER